VTIALDQDSDGEKRYGRCQCPTQPGRIGPTTTGAFVQNSAEEDQRKAEPIQWWTKSSGSKACCARGRQRECGHGGERGKRDAEFDQVQRAVCSGPASRPDQARERRAQLDQTDADDERKGTQLPETPAADGRCESGETRGRHAANRTNDHG